jgi:Flp pilus assembly protein TadD
MKRFWLFAVIAVLLNACSFQPPKKGEPVGPAEILLAQAKEKKAAGETEQAIALIERALRLEPRKAEGWLALARLHYEGGDLHRAEQFARRALQFAGADKKLVQESQELLTKIRKELSPG